jgi:glucokinase
MDPDAISPKTKSEHTRTIPQHRNLTGAHPNRGSPNIFLALFGLHPRPLHADLPSPVQIGLPRETYRMTPPSRRSRPAVSRTAKRTTTRPVVRASSRLPRTHARRSKSFFVGIDLGGTNMQIGVVDANNNLRGASRKKTRAEEGSAAIIDRLARGVQEACDDAGIMPSQVAAIGIGAPGAIDPDAGVVLEAVNLNWTDYKLARILSTRLHTPVFVDNDVNVAVLGEQRMGAAQGASDVLGVWAGTGIGGGIILNGELFYGGYKTAGEIGHTILYPGAPLGERTVENLCSRTNVVNRIAALIKANHKSSLTRLVDGDIEKVRSKTLARAYQEKDPLTMEVVDAAADLLGVSIANYVTMLSLPLVVLGGGLTEAIGSPFVQRVERSVRKYAFPDRCKAVKVVASKLRDNAGVFGAALIAKERR